MPIIYECQECQFCKHYDMIDGRISSFERKMNQKGYKFLTNIDKSKTDIQKSRDKYKDQYEKVVFKRKSFDRSGNRQKSTLAVYGKIKY